MQVGCVDDSYRGVIDVDLSVDNEVPVVVTMKIGEPDDIVGESSSAPASKGTGTVTGKHDLLGKTIHIYAFNQELQTDFTVKAAADTINCLIDASLDNPDSKMGRESVYDPESSSVSDLIWKNEATAPVYYPNGDYSGNNYDFFAYYVDGLELSEDQFDRQEDRIVIRGIEIDGSRDIMTSKAAPTTEQIKTIEALKLSKPSWDLNYYGYNSANNTTYPIAPSFVFTHHLTRLRFKLVAGKVAGAENEVTVESIIVNSPNKGDFTVAVKGDDGNLGFVDGFYPGFETGLALTEADGSEYVPRTLKISSGTEVDDMGCLLIAPGKHDYTMTIVLSEKNPDGTPLPPAPPLEKILTLGDPNNSEDPKRPELDPSRKPFKAGYEYLITMTVYGQMDVRLSATVGEWGNGGNIDYDHDEAMRPGAN